MTLALLNERIGTINDLLTTVNLLVWDSRTMMPPGGAAARGRQIATRTRIARDLACDDEMQRRLEGAERDVAVSGATETDRVAVAQVREAFDAHRASRPSWSNAARYCRPAPCRLGSKPERAMTSPNSNPFSRKPWPWRASRPTPSAGAITLTMRW